MGCGSSFKNAQLFISVFRRPANVFATIFLPKVSSVCLLILILIIISVSFPPLSLSLREFLDQVLFWNTRDLERKLAEFQAYYNAARSHASLKGHTPLTFVSGHTATSADLSHVRWVAHCRDLVQLPVAA